MRKDRRPKARQWTFTVPSFSTGLLDHLSVLIKTPSVGYITFAICEDDTGSKFLFGFIKLMNRCRSSTLTHLIGPSTLEICASAKPALLEIQMNSSFQEFGEDKRSECFRSDVKAAKSMIDNGFSIDDILTSGCATVCSVNPRIVRKYMKSMKSLTAKEEMEESIESKPVAPIKEEVTKMFQANIY